MTITEFEKRLREIVEEDFTLYQLNKNTYVAESNDDVEFIIQNGMVFNRDIVPGKIFYIGRSMDEYLEFVESLKD